MRRLSDLQSEPELLGHTQIHRNTINRTGKKGLGKERQGERLIVQTLPLQLKSKTTQLIQMNTL